MKKFKKIVSIFFLSLFIIAIFSIGITETQALPEQDITFTPQVALPGFGERTLSSDSGTLFIAQYVQAIYNYGISIGAILATVVLMAAGVVWLTSGGSQSQIGRAKEMITGSLVGLSLLFGSWIILNTINPALVDFRISGIDMIQRIDNLACCDFADGPISYIINEKGEVACPEPNHIICELPEVCIKDPLDPTQLYGFDCYIPQNYACLEYVGGWPAELYCQTKIYTGDISFPWTVHEGTTSYERNAVYLGQVCNPDQHGELWRRRLVGSKRKCIDGNE